MGGFWESLDFYLAIAASLFVHFQPFCCRFAGGRIPLVCFMTQFGPSFSSHTDGLSYDELMVDSVTARCPDPVGVNNHSSTPLHDTFLKVNCSLWFYSRILWITINHLFFGLICVKYNFPEYLQYIQMQLCKPKQCCHVLFKERKYFHIFSTPHTVHLQSLYKCVALLSKGPSSHFL